MTLGIPLSPYALRRGRFLAVLGMTLGIPLAPLRFAKGGDSSLRFGMTWVRENDVRGGGAIMVHHSQIVAIVVRIGG